MTMNYGLICKAAQDLEAKLLPDEFLAPGDYYFAHRNGPVKLLTVREIKDGYVIPMEMDYCYDVRECVKALLE